MLSIKYSEVEAHTGLAFVIKDLKTLKNKNNLSNN